MKNIPQILGEALELSQSNPDRLRELVASVKKTEADSAALRDGSEKVSAEVEKATAAVDPADAGTISAISAKKDQVTIYQNRIQALAAKSEKLMDELGIEIERAEKCVSVLARLSCSKLVAERVKLIGDLFEQPYQAQGAIAKTAGHNMLANRAMTFSWIVQHHDRFVAAVEYLRIIDEVLEHGRMMQPKLGGAKAA